MAGSLGSWSHWTASHGAEWDECFRSANLLLLTQSKVLSHGMVPLTCQVVFLCSVNLLETHLETRPRGGRRYIFVVISNLGKLTRQTNDHSVLKLTKLEEKTGKQAEDPESHRESRDGVNCRYNRIWAHI